VEASDRTRTLNGARSRRDDVQGSAHRPLRTPGDPAAPGRSQSVIRSIRERWRKRTLRVVASNPEDAAVKAAEREASPRARATHVPSSRRRPGPILIRLFNARSKIKMDSGFRRNDGLGVVRRGVYAVRETLP